MCEDEIQQDRVDKQEYGPDHLLCAFACVSVCARVYLATSQKSHGGTHMAF